MGSCKWSYKSLNIGYNYSYPTYKPTYTKYRISFWVGVAKAPTMPFVAVKTPKPTSTPWCLVGNLGRVLVL